MKNLIDTLEKIKTAVGNCEVSVETLGDNVFFTVKWSDGCRKKDKVWYSEDWRSRFIEQAQLLRLEIDKSSHGKFPLVECTCGDEKTICIECMSDEIERLRQAEAELKKLFNEWLNSLDDNVYHEWHGTDSQVAKMVLRDALWSDMTDKNVINDSEQGSCFRGEDPGTDAR